MDKIKAVFNWSGGKDSAHALLRAFQSERYEIVALLTTVNRDTQRSTMHGIPLPLLEAQAASIGIPLYIVDLTPKGNMEDYSSAMSQAVEYFKSLGVTHFIFGDIFLHDVRWYREQQLSPFGMEVVEPLWGQSSEKVMEDFLSSDLETVVVTTMADGLGAAFIGKLVNREFVASLPIGVDPNGENGEYHTFCYKGPIFHSPVAFHLGDIFSQSYDIRLDDGTMKTYTYWFANLKEGYATE
ncbi:adenine nucleotide alpha hydrolase [Bacteroides sp. 1001136B_160425_E2]|uniref:adenine nucleotide alpha hydrolase n=1 Tax=Bacteroides sp. 1001136B_160425_E2 TaxID=2787083 RepID=UPI0018A037E9|nr:adenine nucleotide alpha hydrolase [Bacteroides sp. 1001136B_160425_E2]